MIDYCESDGYVNSDYYIYVKKSPNPDSGEDIDVEGDFLENPTVENIRDFLEMLMLTSGCIHIVSHS